MTLAIITLKKVIYWSHFTSRIQFSTLFPILPLKGKSIALDLGCGKGYISIELYQKIDLTISLDISKKKIEELKNLTRVFSGNYQILPILAYATHLPFKDSTIDIVICNSVFEHIENDKRVIEEISRVVIENGVLGFTVPNKTRRFAFWLAPFWKLTFKLPLYLKKRIFQPHFVKMKSITEARSILEKRFDHKHLYTVSILCDLLSPHFTIVELRYYMQFIGAICHDFLYAFKGLKWFVPLYIMRKISTIDKFFTKNVQGKGIAICAIKK